MIYQKDVIDYLARGGFRMGGPLLAWLEDRPQVLPPTVFSCPRGGSVADLSALLAAQMNSSPHVTVHAEKLLHVERGEMIAADLRAAAMMLAR